MGLRVFFVLLCACLVCSGQDTNAVPSPYVLPEGADAGSWWYYVGLVFGIAWGGFAWTLKMVRQGGKQTGYEF